VALASLSLLGLGVAGAWWFTGVGESPTEPLVTAVNAPAPPTESIAAQHAPVASAPASAEAERAAPVDDAVVMLVTVPAGATVTRGKAPLGVTPFALVWDGVRDPRPLEVTLKGYRAEKVRHADIGNSARYELYLRPEEAAPAKRARKRRQPRRKASPGHTATKPVTAGPKAAPAPAKRVYEELD
jgi:hypothetical protein